MKLRYNNAHINPNTYTEIQNCVRFLNHYRGNYEFKY